LNYSQEGRPYALFFLFSVISFYKLIRYIKDPNWKTGLLYGLFAGLMINGHLFGLFALAAQYAILFFFLLIAERARRKQFFLYSAVSGLITLLTFLPAVQLLRMASELKSTWIKVPSAKVYTEIFESFFGNSELLIALISVALIFFFIRLANEQNGLLRYQEIVGSKILLTAVVLIPWIVIVLIIALVRSHLSVPMIVSRYFISVLPPVILLAAIGIDYINNTPIKVGFVLLCMLLALTNIVAVNKYYTAEHKTQFRELSQAVIARNMQKDPVVSRFGMQLSFFFKNQKTPFPLVNASLNEYVDSAIADPSQIRSFWYADGHQVSYAPDTTVKQFIDKNYIIADSVAFFDAWAKHFVIKPGPDSLNRSR
jgi:hypothetical protein